MARSMEVRQVAEPRTISPVRVSAMRMDQVAVAVDAVRAMAARAVFIGLLVMIYLVYQNGGIIPREIFGGFLVQEDEEGGEDLTTEGAEGTEKRGDGGREDEGLKRGERFRWCGGGVGRVGI